MRLAPTPPANVLLALLVFLFGLAGCGEDTATEPDAPTLAELCSLDSDFVTGGAGRDAIPALTDPEMAPPTSTEGLGYLEPESRVVGIEVGGQAYAVPHNILWYHEIVNLNVGGETLAVTYCPLTGSSLTFDRSVIDGAELGVSGLLYLSNLILFERGTDAVVWPQMIASDRCVEPSRPSLPQWPTVEMTWDAWRARHPDGLVVTENTGHAGFVYAESSYPYANYESLDAPFIFPMPALDSRREPKERVLGAPPTADDSGIAFPFGALDELPGAYAVVEFTYDGVPAVLLWSEEARGGTIHRPETVGGQGVTLVATEAGIVDEGTGSRWSVEGRAVGGELEGRELIPVERAFVAFWGAWAAYFPDTRLWTE